MLTVAIRIKAELRAWPLAVLTKRLSLLYTKATQDRISFSQARASRASEKEESNNTPSGWEFLCVCGLSAYLCGVCLICVFGVWGRTRRHNALCLLSLASPHCIFTAACVRALGCVHVWVYSVYMCWCLSVSELLCSQIWIRPQRVWGWYFWWTGSGPHSWTISCPLITSAHTCNSAQSQC